MALFYTDASALVKFVKDEPESEALRIFVGDADLVSSELMLTEMPRAIHKAKANDPALPLDTMLQQAVELLATIVLVTLDRDVLTRAGASMEPTLRSLDAIHVATAATLVDVEAFISYDHRQVEAARLADMHTVSPAP